MIRKPPASGGCGHGEIASDRDGGRWRLLAWLLLMAAALGVRLYRLDRFSYWLDEILQVDTIRAPWGRMWRILRGGIFNPPFDYALLKIFEGLQPADATRRLVPVVWGVLSIAAFGALIARRATWPTGLAAGTLIAFAPYHVRYSQELRPYALGMLLVSLSLLLLDRYLERRTTARLATLYLASVATAYAMYLAALVLIIAGASLVIEDCFAFDSERRGSARRFLLRSPIFAGFVAAAYAPWWPVLWRALRAPPLAAPPHFAWRRIGRLLSYFGFGVRDWSPLGGGGIFFLCLVALGAVLALTRFRLRFLLAWAIAGLTVIELSEHRHGVYDSVFHFLPAGLALTGLAALPVGWLLSRRRLAAFGVTVLAAILILDRRALANYFERGRPDWRPVARFLRNTPHEDPIFADSGYARLCLAYYVIGPDSFCCPVEGQRRIESIEDDPRLLPRSWGDAREAWIVLSGGERAAALRALSSSAPSWSFPTAEGDGGVVVRRLSAPLRR